MGKVGVQEDETNKNVLATMSVASEAPIENSSNLEEKHKVPKRILYFSDGTLEEYSSDEDSETSFKTFDQQVVQANIANLAWVPWFWYHTIYIGSKALGVCDYLGETLANFFGIITPKYEYEIEHYKRVMAEEEERKKHDLEYGGWTDQPLNDKLPNIVKTSDKY